MAAGKTYDVMINGPAANAPALPVYDRELSLSGNAIDRDAGMLAYIGINGAGLPAAVGPGGAAHVKLRCRQHAYPSLLAGKSFSVSDASKGVIANDVNVYGVAVLTAATSGVSSGRQRHVHLHAEFRLDRGHATRFTYCANGQLREGHRSSDHWPR